MNKTEQIKQGDKKAKSKESYENLKGQTQRASPQRFQSLEKLLKAEDKRSYESS